VKRTLILGGGFGGLATATELRRLLGEKHDIVVVDRREHFLAGLRKLWALVGLGTLEEGRRSRTALRDRHVRFLHTDLRSIDPATRRVETADGTLDGDHLVVALGAEPRPDLVPGLAENAHDLYDAASIPSLADALAALERGRIALVIAGGPYKCPPAPYECALLLDEDLRRRGLRDRVSLSVSTFQPLLLPNAGREGSAWLGERLAERGIDFAVGRKVERVEPGRVVYTEGDPLEADLIVGVPPHRVPAVVVESGLAQPGGWVAVDRETLATRWSRVYAIGDVMQIPLANGLPLPKAGLLAELQGNHVAAEISAQVGGLDVPEPFDGRGYCFLEMGRSLATRIEGEFFAAPEPRIAVGEPSGAHAEEKRRFESERLERWFGKG
jgi:sulfide:quinone oxidoreductase